MTKLSPDVISKMLNRFVKHPSHVITYDIAHDTLYPTKYNGQRIYWDKYSIANIQKLKQRLEQTPAFSDKTVIGPIAVTTNDINGIFPYYSYAPIEIGYSPIGVNIVANLIVQVKASNEIKLLSHNWPICKYCGDANTAAQFGFDLVIEKMLLPNVYRRILALAAQETKLRHK